MKITMEELQEFMGYAEVAEEFRPIVKEVIKKGASFLAELAPAVESFRSFGVSSRIKSVAQYKDAGFSKEESILMTIADSQALRDCLSKVGNNQKSSTK